MFFNGFLKSSLIEWPGKICAVVFIGGCNFRCPFCYNRDLVLKSENLPKISEDEVLNYLQEYQDWLEGVMISGGEALAPQTKIKNQKLEIRDGLLDFIKKVKKLGLGVGIETNGSNPEAIKYLIDNNIIDYLAMDIKSPFQIEKYSQLAGVNVDLDKIKESVKIIMDKAPDYEFRTTVVPGLLREEDILKIAESIKGAKRYYLQQFRLPAAPGTGLNNPELEKLIPYPREFFENLRKKIKNYFEICDIRI